MQNYQLGVNVSGYINSEFGLGEAVRSNIRSLESAGIPYVLNNFDLNQHRKEDKTFTEFTDENPYPINLIHINPDMLDDFIRYRRSAYFEGKYNIGYWIWELNQFPENWIRFFDLFNEIWTGSRYSMDTISSVSNIPVLKIPHSINLKTVDDQIELLNTLNDKFVFLYVFDFTSSFQRKNPDKVIRAFLNAFQGNQNVILIIKFSNSEDFTEKRDFLYSLINSQNNIHIIDGYLHRSELLSLFQRADCYISLHASEGFGLTMAEAMFLGKPVIATAYSANMDYMNVNNSFLVKYKLVEIDETDRFYTKGQVWAEPDTEHCQDLMRYVYENKEKAKKIGKQAERDIYENLSDQKVGSLIRERIKRIEQITDNFTATLKETRTKYNIVKIYEQLQNQTIVTHEQQVKIGSLIQEKNVLSLEIQNIRASVVWRIRNLFINILNKLKLTKKTSL